MKKIDKELHKKYTLLLSLIILLYIIPIYYIANYQYSYTRQEIYNVAEFLEAEFKEPEHKDLDYFLPEVLGESPKISNVSIVITHGNLVFKDEDPPSLGELPFREKIQYYDLKYWVLNKKVNTPYNGIIEIRIIKELSPLLTFFKRLIFISFLTLSLLVIVCYKIMNNFYTSFIPELQKIKKISDDIQLDSFDRVISNFNFNTENSYDEFNNIVISYKKMLERIKQHSEQQTDFVNSASHELKTPIFILKNYMSLLKKSLNNNNKELLFESIDTISDEINNMEKLVEKLLFLSKNNSDNSIKTILKEPQNLSEIIEDVVQEMEIIHPEQNIIFEKKEHFINTNWVLCKQVIRNILENAIKYGNNKEIKIFVSYNSKSTYVYIVDKGIGIQKKDLPFIFNKFFRANNLDSQDGSGYGLGLSIVKFITSLLDGNIYVNSIFNEGTTVKILFKN